MSLRIATYGTSLNDLYEGENESEQEFMEDDEVLFFEEIQRYRKSMLTAEALKMIADVPIKQTYKMNLKSSSSKASINLSTIESTKRLSNLPYSNILGSVSSISRSSTRQSLLLSRKQTYTDRTSVCSTKISYNSEKEFTTFELPNPQEVNAVTRIMV